MLPSAFCLLEQELSLSLLFDVSSLSSLSRTWGNCNRGGRETKEEGISRRKWIEPGNEEAERSKGEERKRSKDKTRMQNRRREEEIGSNKERERRDGRGLTATSKRETRRAGRGCIQAESPSPCCDEKRRKQRRSRRTEAERANKSRGKMRKGTKRKERGETRKTRKKRERKQGRDVSE